MSTLLMAAAAWGNVSIAKELVAIGAASEVFAADLNPFSWPT